MFEICSDLSETGFKIYYFCQYSKKAKKWPNGQIILILANSFKKANWQPWSLPANMPNLAKHTPSLKNGQNWLVDTKVSLINVII